MDEIQEINLQNQSLSWSY